MSVWLLLVSERVSSNSLYREVHPLSKSVALHTAYPALLRTVRSDSQKMDLAYKPSPPLMSNSGRLASKMRLV